MNPKDAPAAKSPIPCLLPNYAATPPEEPPFVAILRHQADAFPRVTDGLLTASVRVRYETGQSTPATYATFVIKAPKLSYTCDLFVVASQPEDDDRPVRLVSPWAAETAHYERFSNTEPGFVANLRDALHDPYVIRFIGSLIANSRTETAEKPSAEPQDQRGSVDSETGSFLYED